MTIYVQFNCVVLLILYLERVREHKADNKSISYKKSIVKDKVTDLVGMTSYVQFNCVFL